MKSQRGSGEHGDLRKWELYATLHCHHQNDFCIKMGSDERHLTILLVGRGSGGDRHPTVGGGRGKLYLILFCHHLNDSCIKMGSDESH